MRSIFRVGALPSGWTAPTRLATLADLPTRGGKRKRACLRKNSTTSSPVSALRPPPATGAAFRIASPRTASITTTSMARIAGATRSPTCWKISSTATRRNMIGPFFDPVCNGDIGLRAVPVALRLDHPRVQWREVVIDGISRFVLRDELIGEYHESVNGGVAQSQLGVPAERMVKVMAKWTRRFRENADVEAYAAAARARYIGGG